MQEVAGLLRSTIPNNSFFDVKSEESKNQYLNHLNLICKLTGIENDELDQIKTHKVKVEDDTFILINNLPNKIWSSLPIQSHEIVKTTPKIENIVTTALQHLQKNHFYAYELIKEFVHSIVYVKLKTDFTGQDSQITSSSFPIMPLSIFISDKAGFHIPPNNISKDISHRFVAENIYHEAIHQVINMNILLFDIFNENFDSKYSPKIEIPWRYNQVKRNQYWELDRAYHATIVYSRVLRYRINELRDESLLAFEKNIFEGAVKSGVDAVTHLIKSLEQYKSYFSANGQEQLDILHEDIKQVLKSF